MFRPAILDTHISVAWNSGLDQLDLSAATRVPDLTI